MCEFKLEHIEEDETTKNWFINCYISELPAYLTRQDIAQQQHHPERVPSLSHPTQQGSKILKQLAMRKKTGPYGVHEHN
jgi:hypothetical protein